MGFIQKWDEDGIKSLLGLSSKSAQPAESAEQKEKEEEDPDKNLFGEDDAAKEAKEKEAKEKEASVAAAELRTLQDAYIKLDSGRKVIMQIKPLACGLVEDSVQQQFASILSKANQAWLQQVAAVVVQCCLSEIFVAPEMYKNVKESVQGVLKFAHATFGYKKTSLPKKLLERVSAVDSAASGSGSGSGGKEPKPKEAKAEPKGKKAKKTEGVEAGEPAAKRPRTAELVGNLVSDAIQKTATSRQRQKVEVGPESLDHHPHHHRR